MALSEEEMKGVLFEKMKDEVKMRGGDPELVEKDDISFQKDSNNIHVKWKDVEVTVPAPSQESIDSWFKKNGQVIAGSLVTLAGVTVGGLLTLGAVALLNRIKPG